MKSLDNNIQLTKPQQVTLSILNAIDAIFILFVIVIACYNVYKFIYKAKIRQFFIIVFYVLALFCLVSWEVTAVAQTIDPDTRYLVFQENDHPSFYHVTADFSQGAFLVLFALGSVTMYHLDLSLRLLLPNVFHLDEKQFNKKIKVY